MRAMNLSNALSSRGHNTLIWSTDFNHLTKKHRFNKFSSIKISNYIRVNLVPSIGYKKNVSLRRLVDHLQLAINLRRRLKSEALPDFAIIGYPPIETAWVLVKFLNKRGIPTMLDVKDAWPEILLRKCPKQVIQFGRLILSPYFAMMKQTFNSVKFFSAPSSEFLQWCIGRTNRKQNSLDCVLPLTTPDVEFSNFELENAKLYLNSKGIRDSSDFRVSFIGTLSESFNFKPIFAASKSLPFDFVIAGDGPKSESLKEQFKNSKNVIFTGRLSAVQSYALMQRSSVMLAPYNNSPDFEISVPNKIYDYMRNGKPILTSLRGPTLNLILDNNLGFYYDNSDLGSLGEKLSYLSKDTALVLEISNNASRLYKEKYSYKLVYESFVAHLESVVNEK
jgi:glycosyltransferase involved in cell wall biosynthesis